MKHPFSIFVLASLAVLFTHITAIASDFQSGPVACTAVSTPNPAPIGTPITVSAVLAPDSGVGPYEIVLTTNAPSLSLVSTSAFSKVVVSKTPGVYEFKMDVVNTQSGASVSCKTLQVFSVPPLYSNLETGLQVLTLIRSNN